MQLKNNYIVGSESLNKKEDKKSQQRKKLVKTNERTCNGKSFDKKKETKKTIKTG